MELPLLRLDGDDEAPTSLDEVRAGGAAVVDFWTTGCERCPACLSKLEALAPTCAGTRFVSVCLDEDATKAAEMALRWPTFAAHCRVPNLQVKEEIKATWGFKYVPFVVVVAHDGSTAFAGSGAADIAEAVRAAVVVEKENAPPPQESLFRTDEDF